MHSASGSLQANPSWYSAGKRRSAAPAFPLPLNPGLYNPSYHRRLSASRQEDYYRGQDPDEAVDSTSPAATQEAEGRRPPALPPGVLYLLIVAVLWGSYSPALRWVALLPCGGCGHPPPPSLRASADAGMRSRCRGRRQQRF